MSANVLVTHMKKAELPEATISMKAMPLLEDTKGKQLKLEQFLFLNTTMYDLGARLCNTRYQVTKYYCACVNSGTQTLFSSPIIITIHDSLGTRLVKQSNLEI